MVCLSILGLNEYTDGHVWDRFAVPDGVSRQDCIDNIMAQCAELSLVYPHPATMKFMIGLWTRKNMDNWVQLWKDTGASQVAGFNQDANLADRDAAQSDHTGHIYGNIGVTTAAQMIAGEMDIRTRFNLLDVICDSFKDEFCVQVY